MTWITEHQSPEKVEALRTRLRDEDTIFWGMAKSFAGADDDFALWLYVANVHVMRRIGMPLYDMEDWLWRDSFDDGESPASAARQYLAECN